MPNADQKPDGMLPDYLRSFLKTPPHLLNSFHYEDVMDYLKLGEEERFENGDLIIQEGKSISCSYIIASGTVSVWKEGIQLALLSEGNVIVESFLFQRTNTMDKIQAESTVVALKFERHDVLNFFRKRPGKLFNIFTKNIIEIQQKKLHNMNLQVIQLKKKLLDEKKW
ncbi:MAG: cyclic nucleotide-binding domain-containing protein [Balneolaceae bacterium]